MEEVNLPDTEKAKELYQISSTRFRTLLSEETLLGRDYYEIPQEEILDEVPSTR